MADGLGVEAGVQGGYSSGLAAEKELDVAEELCDALELCSGRRRRGNVGGYVVGDREIGEGEAVVRPAYALSPESRHGEAFSGLKEDHGVLH